MLHEWGFRPPNCSDNVSIFGPELKRCAMAVDIVLPARLVSGFVKLLIAWSTTTASTLLASYVASTQAPANCSPPTAVGWFSASTTSNCSQQCLPQRSENTNVHRPLKKLSIWTNASRQRSQQELKPEPLRQPRALEERPCAHKLFLRVVPSTRTPPPLRLPERRRVNPSRLRHKRFGRCPLNLQRPRPAQCCLHSTRATAAARL